MLRIEPYNDSHYAAFRELNMQWLLLYNLAEEPDLRVLSDPRGEIIARGGFIWVATFNEMVVGTAALVKEPDHCYEIAKMSVSPEYRGQGVGRKLIETCINQARAIGAKKVELF